MTHEFIEYPDREMLMFALADRLASDLGQQLRNCDNISLCVPGGATPVPLFETLSGADIEWDRVTVFLGDERWVPEDHQRSNTALLRRHLLKDRAGAATLLPLYTGVDTPEAAAAERAEALAPHLPISVLLLGMGNDMHTASLFPDMPGLEAALAADTPVIGLSEGVPEPRITLTAPTLNGAICKHILITGPEKRAALEAAAGLDPSKAPVRAVLDGATVHWAE